MITKQTAATLGLCLTRFEHAHSYVKDHIDEIGKKARYPKLFKDVKAACNEKRAFLFTSPKVDGFFVLRPRPANVMQVWVAYCTEKNAVAQYQQVIESLCIEAGATDIEFETSLPTMERFMPRFGWVKAYTVWRKPL